LIENERLGGINGEDVSFQAHSIGLSSRPLVLRTESHSRPLSRVPPRYGFYESPHLTFPQFIVNSNSPGKAKMDPKQFLILLAMLGVASLVAYAYRKLLALSQNKEDLEDEQLWHYLLNPRT
jgi:hypothetical protein